MNISEDFLVRKIKKFAEKRKEVERSIGDDAAVVAIEKGRYVFTQDMLLEGIHFDRSFMSLEDIGKKAIYVNVSDILSMGAEPLYFLLSFGIPDHLSLREISEVLKGIRKASQEFNLCLIGGDLSRSNGGFMIDVSMFGRLVSRTYLGRNMARTGDLIALTGYLGESSFGLYLLKSGKVDKGFERFIQRFKNPIPPYKLWKELIKNDIPNAMMDISDGLIIDLERLLTESKKGGNVYFENIPIPGILVKEKKEMLALTGGEDYQFLFTFSKEKMPLFEELKKKGFLLHIIGDVTEKKGLRIFKNGKKMSIQKKGYDHFLRTNG